MTNPRQNGAESWPPFGRFLAVLVRGFLWLLGPVTIHDRNRVPHTGGVLILANHLSDLDPVVVQLACPRPIYFMAKSELFDMRSIGWFLRFWRAFPVKRGESDIASMKLAIRYLKEGRVVCVFPEGELSETGRLGVIHAGVALIAKQAGVPVVCLGLEGTNRVMPFKSTIARPSFRRIHCRYGEVHEPFKKESNEDIVNWARCSLLTLGAIEAPLTTVSAT